MSVTRSLLFAPGSSPKMMAKSRRSGADVVSFDSVSLDAHGLVFAALQATGANGHFSLCKEHPARRCFMGRYRTAGTILRIGAENLKRPPSNSAVKCRTISPMLTYSPEIGPRIAGKFQL
jgi:hypothetical protein